MRAPARRTARAERDERQASSTHARGLLRAGSVFVIDSLALWLLWFLTRRLEGHRWEERLSIGGACAAPAASNRAPRRPRKPAPAASLALASAGRPTPAAVCGQVPALLAALGLFLRLRAAPLRAAAGRRRLATTTTSSSTSTPPLHPLRFHHHHPHPPPPPPSARPRPLPPPRRPSRSRSRCSFCSSRTSTTRCRASGTPRTDPACARTGCARRRAAPSSASGRPCSPCRPRPPRRTRPSPGTTWRRLLRPSPRRPPRRLSSVAVMRRPNRNRRRQSRRALSPRRSGFGCAWPPCEVFGRNCSFCRGCMVYVVLTYVIRIGHARRSPLCEMLGVFGSTASDYGS